MRLIDADALKKALKEHFSDEDDDVELIEIGACWYHGAVLQQIDNAPTQLNQTDTLIIANALMYLINDEERHELDRATAESLREQILKHGASMCKGGDDE